ncbi:MAG: hypothetical protein ACYC91_05550 [Solirubrobacteraceae bacterium]
MTYRRPDQPSSGDVRWAIGSPGSTPVHGNRGARQPGARHLYESEGYRGIGNFNANPVATFFGEKAFDP